MPRGGTNEETESFVNIPDVFPPNSKIQATFKKNYPLFLSTTTSSYSSSFTAMSAATATAAATTASQIIFLTTSFLSETISQPDFRCHLFQTLSNRIPLSLQTTALKPLKLASRALEESIFSADPSVQSSSLRNAERLLLSCPESPFSCFLLSLVYALTHQPSNACLSLLNIFHLDPSLARSEILPGLFEDIFLTHFMPFVQCFNERRSKILSSSPSVETGYDGNDKSLYDVSVVVIPSSKLLSKISGVQALELKELERTYEEVLDENCRVFANYFKEVLENNDGNRLIRPPSVILKEIGNSEEKIKTNEIGLENGRFNDSVHNLAIANGISCFIPQGSGVKVHSWNGGSKLLNQNKSVKCLSLAHGKLYCGCHDGSIQEIDLATGAIVTIQNGSRKLLGKTNSVHALQVCNGVIYSASSAIDGSVVKLWEASNYEVVGSLSTTLEVRTMIISSDLIYLGSKAGIVEIWDLKKQNKIEVLQTGPNARILCMALVASEEVLVIGTSDGWIQAWELC